MWTYNQQLLHPKLGLLNIKLRGHLVPNLLHSKELEIKWRYVFTLCLVALSAHYHVLTCQSSLSILLAHRVWLEVFVTQPALHEKNGKHKTCTNKYKWDSITSNSISFVYENLSVPFNWCWDLWSCLQNSRIKLHRFLTFQNGSHHLLISYDATIDADALNQSLCLLLTAPKLVPQRSEFQIDVLM